MGFFKKKKEQPSEYPTRPSSGYNGGYPSIPAPGGAYRTNQKAKSRFEVLRKALSGLESQKKSAPHYEKQNYDNSIKSMRSELAELKRQEKYYKTQESQFRTQKQISQTRERIKKLQGGDDYGLPSALQDPIFGSSKGISALDSFGLGSSKKKKRSNGLLGDDFNITL